MKTINLIATKVVALVLVMIMLFSLSVPALAVNVKVEETDYYKIEYNSDATIPEAVLTLNVSELTEFVKDRNFTKEELKKFLPDILAKVLETRQMPSLDEIIDFIPDELLSLDEINKLFPTELIDKNAIIADLMPSNEVIADLLKGVSEEDKEKLFDEVDYTLFVKGDLRDELIREYPNEIKGVIKNNISDFEDELYSTDVLTALLDGTAITNVTNIITGNPTYTNKLIELVEPAKLQTLIVGNPTTMNKLLTGDVPGDVVNLIGVDKVATLFNVNDLKELLDRTNDAEFLATNPEAADAITYIRNKYPLKFEDLIKSKASTIISMVDKAKLIDVLGGITNIIDAVGSLSDITNSAFKDGKTIADAAKIVDDIDVLIDALGNTGAVIDKLDNLGKLDAIIAKIKVADIVTAIGEENIIPKLDIMQLVEDDIIDVNAVINTIGVNKLMNVIDKNAVIAKAKEELSALLFGRLQQIDFYIESNGKKYDAIAFSTDVVSTIHAQNIVDTLLQSVPTEETLSSIEDGETIYYIAVEATFQNASKPANFALKVVVDGDTSAINKYAAEVFDLVHYEFGKDINVEIKVDDSVADAPVIFSKVLTKTLNTDRLTDAEKAKLFNLFNATGTELYDQLKAIDVNLFSKFLDAKYVNYLKTLREKMITFLDKAIEYIPEEILSFSFANTYVANSSTFTFDKDIAVSTDKYYNKIVELLASKVDGIDADFILNTFQIDPIISGSLDLNIKMDDVYRVRYFDKNENLIYTIFLPLGTKLTAVDALNGVLAQVSPDGWAIETNKTVKVDVTAGGDLDLYPLEKAPDDTTKPVDPPTPPTPERETYRIVYDANGGKGTMTAQTVAYGVSTKLVMNRFTREGYTFIGWNTEADGTGTSYPDGATVRNLVREGTVVLYAQWKQGTAYTATFVADGVVVATVNFYAGDTELSEVPAVPAKTGYTGAWEAYTLGNENITINAIYTANTYTVSFDANGGTGSMAPVTMTYDTAANLPANAFTKDGYIFTGWNSKADGTGTAYGAGASVQNLAESGNVTLFAQWKEAKTYTATFMADGKVVGTVTFKEGDTKLSSTPTVPAKTGYKAAWEKYTLTNADITINAVYTANTYTIYFRANNGKGTMAALKVTYDVATALTANSFTRDGYTFNGWNTKADGTGASYTDGQTIKNLAASGDLFLYAQWKKDAVVTEPPVTVTEPPVTVTEPPVTVTEPPVTSEITTGPVTPPDDPQDPGDDKIANLGKALVPTILIIAVLGVGAAAIFFLKKKK